MRGARGAWQPQSYINTRPRPRARMPERSMPVCLTEAQHRIITEYAKRRGMTDAGQAVESMLD